MTIYLLSESSSSPGEQYLGPVPPPERYIPWLRRYDGSPEELLALSYELDACSPQDRFSVTAAREIRAVILYYLTFVKTPTTQG